MATQHAVALEAERRLAAQRQHLVAAAAPVSAARGSPPPRTPPHRVTALRERANALRDALVASPSTPKSTGRTHECDGADSVTSGERSTLQHQSRCAWGFKMKPRAL